jgi:lysophospholipase L1-like esterase
MCDVACAAVEKELSRPVRSAIISLGGFPAPRAEKYLKRRVLDGLKPHYVIIQFSSLDAQCALRKGNRTAPSGPHALSAPNRDRHQRLPATVFSLLRWEIASLIGRLRRLEPTTPLLLHLAAVQRMVKGCRAAGAMPVVLSPFLYGSRYTTKNAIGYTRALQDLAKAQGVIFVDCTHALSSRTKRQILQHDGFHLSSIGQQLIGQAIAKAIVANVMGQKTVEHVQSVPSPCSQAAHASAGANTEPH